MQTQVAQVAEMGEPYTSRSTILYMKAVRVVLFTWGPTLLIFCIMDEHLCMNICRKKCIMDVLIANWPITDLKARAPSLALPSATLAQRRIASSSP